MPSYFCTIPRLQDPGVPSTLEKLLPSICTQSAPYAHFFVWFNLTLDIGSSMFDVPSFQPVQGKKNQSLLSWLQGQVHLYRVFNSKPGTGFLYPAICGGGDSMIPGFG